MRVPAAAERRADVVRMAEERGIHDEVMRIATARVAMAMQAEGLDIDDIPFYIGGKSEREERIWERCSDR
jgi:hypothetical protein